MFDDVIQTFLHDAKQIDFILRGENAIKIYLSDDRNKIPVLFQAELFVGSVKVDMYKYEGLRSKLNIVAAQ